MRDAAEYHAARILILLFALAPRGGKVRGLTKLVKLDFLLRYPQFLERLLSAEGEGWPSGLEPTHSESLAVEAPMIRYKYGPWDDRYYPIVGYLVGTGLADVRYESGTMVVALTKEGRRLARQLSDDPVWRVTAGRAGLINRLFGDLTGNAIRERIYVEFPEMIDTPIREEI